MTKKEKLYLELKELKNEYYTLKGELDKVIELTDEYLNSYQFSHNVQHAKVSVLEYEIARMKEWIDSVKKELKREAYFNTPEGKEYKEKLITERDKVLEMIRANEEGARNRISDIIEDYLGKGWEVCGLGRWSRIRYIKGFDENGQPLVKRSYDFSIDYEKLSNGEEVFRMNYPTCGSWDLFNDEDMRTYLAGVGKFGTDKSVLNAIMDIIKSWLELNNTLSDKLYKIDDRLRNPETLKD